MPYSTAYEPFPLPPSAPSTLAVATDLTDLERLLPHAIAQAIREHASLHLIHALPPSDTARLSNGRSPCSEADRPPACAILEAAQQRIEAAGLRCSTLLERGVPAEVVLQALRATAATRLLLGTHGHGSTGQQIFGCTANTLLRNSPVPVFVVGPHLASEPPHTTPTRILHPVSLTGRYRESAFAACRMAQAMGAELLFLHVVDFAILRGSYVPEILTRKNRDLETLKSEDRYASSIRTVVSCGTTVQEILRIATVTDSDWIVMGIEHDYPWWSKSNNASYRVISQSDRPVVVLRETSPVVRLPEHQTHQAPLNR